MRPLVLFLFTAAALAQTPEAAVLGGPCEEEKPDDIPQIRDWHGRVTKALDAERRGDFVQAAEAAKLVVRGRCSNEHWWLKLAELQTRAGRDQEAVAVLEAAYDRYANALVRRLADQESPLHALSQSDAYRRSPLAATVAEAGAARDLRREEAQARLAAMPRDERVQSYIARDACPGECCFYGTWSALEDVALYDHPGGYSIVARAAKGGQVEALRGEVHLSAIPALVRLPNPYGLAVEEGAIVFLLDYLGEGHGRISANRRIVEGHVLSVHEHCPSPSEDCWAEVVNPEDAGRQRDHAWWVQIQTPDGLVGWTDEVQKFSR